MPTVAQITAAAKAAGSLEDSLNALNVKQAALDTAVTTKDMHAADAATQAAQDTAAVDTASTEVVTQSVAVKDADDALASALVGILPTPVAPPNPLL